MTQTAQLDQPAPAAGGTPESRARWVLRSILHGSLAYGTANFGIKGLNYLVLLPLYTRYLTPADYGIIGLSETIAMLFVTVCSLGQRDATRRLYFQYAGEPSHLREYISTVLRAGILSLWAVTAILLALGPRLQHALAPGFSVPFYPFVALAIMTAAAQSVVEPKLLLYQLQQKPGKYLLFAVALFLGIAGFAITFVVFMGMGAFGMLLGKLVATAMAAVVALYLLRGWFSGDFRWSFVSETLKLGIPLVPFALTARALDIADRFILEHYRPLSEVGIYSLAYTLGMVMGAVAFSLWQAWSPIYFDLARAGEENRAVLGRLASGLMLVLIAIATAGVILQAPFVGIFVNQRYAGVTGVLPWIIGGYLLNALSDIFQLAAFQAKRTQWLFVIGGVVVVINIGLNFWLVPKIGMYGSAYATTIAFALHATAMFFLAQRVYRLRYNLGQLLAALAVFFAVVVWSTLGHMPAGWLPSLGTLAITLALLAAIAGREIGSIARLVSSRSR